MKIDIVSVFPEYFEVMNLSLMGKAQAKGLLEIKAHNLRDWTHDVHHSVDVTPVGGGAGMVMKPEVWSECLDELLGFSQPSGSPAPSGAPVLIFPNPSAPLFTQRDATELSHADVREYSIGDYVLNGGEVAVSVMLEAITRLMPGFMGNPDSIVEESYTGEGALLEHRQYTKPAVWRGIAVPDVLLSGDHGKVDRFRRDEALARAGSPINSPHGGRFPTRRNRRNALYPSRHPRIRCRRRRFRRSCGFR